MQDIILKENFPDLVLKLSEGDPESIVRASALKCLQEIVKNSFLWERVKDDNIPVSPPCKPDRQYKRNFQQKILQTLTNETEGVVRSEAVSLMRHLFSHQELPEDIMPQIYSMMAAAATLDLHWEVKKEALNFWEKVIWERLRNQGMIDGAFPEVTFSKEHRKIVTLTQPEVQKRLNKVLLELSGHGCLEVLVSTVQNECDIEVVKRGVDIVKKFSAILKTYNVVRCEEIRSPCSPSAKSDCFNFAANSQDVQINGVKKFLEFVRQDLDKLVENKTTWLKSTDIFESVLDDTLRESENNDAINGMDCY